MTDDWTKEIRERLEKATPGPWETVHMDCIDLPNGQRINCTSFTTENEICAHAPTDIANLLKEREVLRNSLRAIQTGWIMFRDTQAINEIDKSLAYDPTKEKV